MDKLRHLVDRASRVLREGSRLESQPSRRQRELSWADLVIVLAGLLAVTPLLVGLTDILMSAVQAVPVVGRLVRPGLLVAAALMIAVQALPLGDAGFRFGAILVGVAPILALAPLSTALGWIGVRLDPYWPALAGTLLLLKHSQRLGCARALTVGMVLGGFLVSVYGYPPVAWPGFGMWLTVAAGAILVISER